MGVLRTPQNYKLSKAALVALRPSGPFGLASAPHCTARARAHVRLLSRVRNIHADIRIKRSQQQRPDKHDPGQDQGYGPF
ncbi:hypothetical protein WJX79_008542 [Trebouxia sp. C0005]